MIATSIDGTAVNPLIDLLTNADAYAARLKELQDATDRFQEIVALAGPATEIVAMRKQIAAQQQALDDATKAANAEATALVADAKAEAQQLVADAQAEATRVRAAAKKLMDDAIAAQADAQAKQQSAAIAKTAADAAKADFEAKSADLDVQLEAAKAAESEAQQTRDDILAKHQAFIESL